MKLVVVAAGFTPGEADQLRRAMGSLEARPASSNQFEQKLIDGMLANGYTEEFARNLFGQIEGFGSYGFPESHAASFALLVYVSAWIKCHYPAVFLAALLNSQPMGFYGPSQLVTDARRAWRRGPSRRRQSERLRLHARAPTTKTAHWPCGWAGRRSRDCRKPRPRRWSASAEAGPFTSYGDFVARTGLTAAVLSRLAAADAFRSLGLTRRPASGCRWPRPQLSHCSPICPTRHPPACRGFHPRRK